MILGEHLSREPQNCPNSSLSRGFYEVPFCVPPIFQDGFHTRMFLGKTLYCLGLPHASILAFRAAFALNNTGEALKYLSLAYTTIHDHANAEIAYYMATNISLHTMPRASPPVVAPVSLEDTRPRSRDSLPPDSGVCEQMKSVVQVFKALPIVPKPPRPVYSSHHCEHYDDGAMSCSFSNVGFFLNMSALPKGSPTDLGKVLYYHRPSSPPDADTLTYIDSSLRHGPWDHCTNLTLAAHAMHDDCEYLPGRTLWLTHIHGHSGHMTEVAWKLVLDVIAFGRVDQIVVRGSVEKDCMCLVEFQMDMIRLAFADTGFQLPPVHCLSMGAQGYARKTTGRPLCFEHVMHVRQTHTRFRSLEEANLVRARAYEMCSLLPPPIDDGQMVLGLFQRKYDRFITNMDEVVRVAESLGFQVRLLQEQLSFCHSIAQLLDVHVVMGRMGSALMTVPFMRPLSVLVVIHNIHWWDPHDKIAATSAGLRVLELMIVNSTQPLIPGFKRDIQGLEEAQVPFCGLLDDPTMVFVFDRCRFLWYRSNVYLPPHHARSFLTEAAHMVNNPATRRCERPGLARWPLPLTSVMFYEANGELCEPERGCVCCSDWACSMGAAIRQLGTRVSFGYKLKYAEPISAN